MPEIAVIISLVSLVIALATVNTAYRYKHRSRTRYRRANPRCASCGKALNNYILHKCKETHNG